MPLEFGLYGQIEVRLTWHPSSSKIADPAVMLMVGNTGTDLSDPAVVMVVGWVALVTL